MSGSRNIAPDIETRKVLCHPRDHADGDIEVHQRLRRV
jgi:hypothetical protein